MIRNVLIAVLAVAAGVFAGLYAKEKHHTVTPTAIATPVSVDSATHDEDLAAKDAEILTLRQEIAKLRSRLTVEMNKGSEARAPRVAGKRARMGVADGTPGQPMSLSSLPTNLQSLVQDALSSAFTNAGLTRAFGFPQARNVDALYASLLSKLGLTDEKKRAFLERLRQKNSLVEVRLGEEKGAAEDEELKRLLGDHDYAQWQEYERTVPARSAVQEFESAMRGENLALNDSQRERLVGLFAQHGVESGQGNAFQIDFNPSESVEKQVSREVDRPLDNWSALVSEAGGVLDERQMHSLDAYLGRRLSEREENASHVGDILRQMSSNAPAGGSVRVMSVTHSTVLSGSGEAADEASAGTP